MPRKPPPEYEETFDVAASGNLFFLHDPARFQNMEESAYYYWYAFLREAALRKEGRRYDTNHALWATFGDVVDRSFMQWWKETAEEVFVDSYGLLHGAEEITNPQQFRKAFDEGDLIIRVNLGCSSDWIRHCIRKILENWELNGRKGEKTQGADSTIEGDFAFLKFPMSDT
jgi:hypothetical protein